MQGGIIISDMIEIELNKNLDYEVYLDFCDFNVAGVNFGEKITKDHPEINKENYIKYIDDFYTKNRLLLTEAKENINNLLKTKQDAFYLAINEVFGEDIPKEKYIGSLSIFNCNPRYPETKTFQIFYKKNNLDMLEVALHESLHFIFFNYCDNYFYEETKDLNKNSGSYWELSEIVNVIILNLPPFQKILEKEEKLFYPELAEKLNEAKKVFKSSKNFKEFIKKELSK